MDFIHCVVITYFLLQMKAWKKAVAAVGMVIVIVASADVGAETVGHVTAEDKTTLLWTKWDEEIDMKMTISFLVGSIVKSEFDFCKIK